MKILEDRGQGFKLLLYTRLLRTIQIFGLLFGILTLLSILRREDQVTLSWKFLWLEDVSWEILNFMVIMVVCTIFRPSPRSKMLSYLSQIPMSEEEADEQEGREIEMREEDVLREEDFMVPEDVDLSDDEDVWGVEMREFDSLPPVTAPLEDDDDEIKPPQNPEQVVEDV